MRPFVLLRLALRMQDRRNMMLGEALLFLAPPADISRAMRRILRPAA